MRFSPFISRYGPHRMRPFIKIILGQTAVFLALLIATEGAVRVLRPDVLPENLDVNLFDPFAYGETYGYKAHAQGNEFGAMYVTDEHGFRINPKSRPVDAQRTILVLGEIPSASASVWRRMKPIPTFSNRS
jgi:hypothetical protein